MSLPIHKIVIHCSATQNGKQLRTATQTAAQRIDDWHKQRGYRRTEQHRKAFNPHLAHIGYHFIIDTDGSVETGRSVGEMGAHVKGHNFRSVGICLVGGITASGKNHGEYTEAQWQSLHQLLRELESKHPKAKICGHRDLSPDTNHNGKVEKHEWLKDCPCFDVWSWLDSEEVINVEHLFKE